MTKCIKIGGPVILLALISCSLLVLGPVLYATDCNASTTDNSVEIFDTDYFVDFDPIYRLISGEIGLFPIIIMEPPVIIDPCTPTPVLYSVGMMPISGPILPTDFDGPILPTDFDGPIN